MRQKVVTHHFTLASGYLLWTPGGPESTFVPPPLLPRIPVNNLQCISILLFCSDDSSSESPSAIRFAVRSLGWVRINEEDLTPERSSKAVNKCIVDLSHGKNDLLDVVGRWGDVSATPSTLDVSHVH